LLTDIRLPDCDETALLARLSDVLIGHTDDMAMFRLQDGGASSDGNGEKRIEHLNQAQVVVLFISLMELSCVCHCSGRGEQHRSTQTLELG
jgi:hypothetical protein